MYNRHHPTDNPPPTIGEAIGRTIVITILGAISIAICAGVLLPAQDVDREINRMIASVIGGGK